MPKADFQKLTLVRSYLCEDEEGNLWRVEVRAHPHSPGLMFSARFKVGDHLQDQRAALCMGAFHINQERED